MVKTYAIAAMVTPLSGSALQLLRTSRDVWQRECAATARPASGHLTSEIDIPSLHLLFVSFGLVGRQVAFENHLEGQEHNPHVRRKRCISNVPLVHFFLLF